MNNFDNFDDLVKKKMEGMEFPFSEENWQKAAQMIDASRPVAKKSVLKTIAFTLVALGICSIAGYLIFSGFKTDVNEMATAQNTSGPVISEAVASESKSNTTAEISKGNHNESTGKKPKTSKSEFSSVAMAESSYNNVNAPAASEKNKNTEDITHQSYNHAKIDQGDNSGQLIHHENAVISSVGAIENAKQKNTSETTDVFEVTEAVIEKPLSDETVVISDNLNSDKTSPSSSIASVKTSTASSLQPDTANTIHVKRDYVRVKHHELLAEAGALNSFGWKVGEKRNGNSLTPLAGLNYIYHFNHSSALQTGIQYNAISNLTESSVSFSVTSYNFGSKSDVTTFKLTELQQLIIPVKYLHTFDKKHTIGLGMNVSYLMNIKNRIETFKVIDGGAGTVASRNDNGYGFELCRTFNGQIAISYGYRITEKLTVQAEFNKTLLNLFNNYSVFNNKETSNRPAALKLSLTYSLFRK